MKMKTVPLADVLWMAANRYLSPTQYPFGDATVFSCCAAAAAESGDKDGCSKASDWLESHGAVTYGFRDFDVGEQRQGVRYMWLLLAMHVAADEGLTVEIPS